MENIESQPVKWLWPNKIALGKVTILAGDPGLGKSFVTIDWAARVSNGGIWPDGSEGCKGSVIIISAEDDPSDTIRPRLESAGANLSRIEVLKAVQFENPAEEKIVERFFNLVEDLAVLKECLKERDDCRLIIIDPMSAFLMGIDTHRNSDIRSALAPLSEMASEFDVAIVMVEHLNKSSNSPASYRVGGSIGITGLARAVHFIVKDPEDSQSRYFLPMKNNLAEDMSGLSFRLQESQSGLVPSIAWSSIPVCVDLDTILGQQSKKPERRTQTDDAVDWLKEYLEDGEQPAKEIFADAEENGFSKKVLQSASTRLKVSKGKLGFSEGWGWSLPQDSLSIHHTKKRESSDSSQQSEGTFDNVWPENPQDALL